MLKGFTVFILSIIGFAISSHAQNWEWRKLYDLQLDSGAIWSVDVSKQVYIFQQQNITKYTSSGKKSLVQSFKSLGDISGIDANNQLKIAVFSEEQQTLCFLDNALATSSDCISLNDFNIQWADLFATSNQTDRFWIFDQVNSELRLLTTGEQQQQTVQNLKQISDIGTPLMMVERYNNLYILDDKNQLSRFDIFGTLIDIVPFEGYTNYFTSDFNLFGIKNNEIYLLFSFLDGDALEKPVTKIPTELTEELVSIRAIGDCFFFSTKNQLSAYQIMAE